MIGQAIALTVYNRFMLSRGTARGKAAALAVVRDILSRYVDEETLERECRRVASALDVSLEMKTLFIHPWKNPLLFFGNPFELSPRTFAKMVVEASLQASELLDREGFA